MCFYLQDNNGYQTPCSVFMSPWSEDIQIIDLAASSFAVGVTITEILLAYEK